METLLFSCSPQRHLARAGCRKNSSVYCFHEKAANAAAIQCHRHGHCRRRHCSVAAAASGTPPRVAAATARVFRALCPLVGWEPLEAALGERFPSALQLHHFVIIEVLASTEHTAGNSRGSSNGGSLVTAFDFLPSDPTSPLTAAILLSGGAVQGTTRCRQLRGVPRQRCILQGTTELADPLAAAAAFQEQYDRRLQLLRNDCTHHASQLVAYLLGSGSSAGSNATGRFG